MLGLDCGAVTCSSTSDSSEILSKESAAELDGRRERVGDLVWELGRSAIQRGIGFVGLGRKDGPLMGSRTET